MFFLIVRYNMIFILKITATFAAETAAVCEHFTTPTTKRREGREGREGRD
jgi:hypothetical protein